LRPELSLHRSLVFSIDYTRFHTAEQSAKVLTELSKLNASSYGSIYLLWGKKKKETKKKKRKTTAQTNVAF
jgi:hypothetical protein